MSLAVLIMRYWWVFIVAGIGLYLVFSFDLLPASIVSSQVRIEIPCGSIVACNSYLSSGYTQDQISQLGLSCNNNVCSIAGYPEVTEQ